MLLSYDNELHTYIEATLPFYISYPRLELTKQDQNQYCLDIPISYIVLGSHS